VHDTEKKQKEEGKIVKKKGMFPFRHTGMFGLLSVVVILSIILLFPHMTQAQGKSPAQPSKVKAPDIIKLATYDIGATAYSMYGFLGEAMGEKFKTKLRAMPIGTDIARMIPVKNKQVEFCGQCGDVYFAAEGLDRYADKNWGPQPLRIVWLARQPGLVGIVRGDSGIKKSADLKGKKVPWIPGSVFNTFHEGLLAFGNLTWNDVQKVQVSGFGAMLKALVDGKIDVAMAAITVPPAYELQASPSGVGYIELPVADKAGWARLHKVLPALSPYKAKFGPGVSDAKPVECSSYPYPATVAYDFLDDNMAYFMTKAINETYPVMAKKSDLMKRFWSLEECLSLYENSKGLIFHPGSVRYLKEIGVWNAKWDQVQAKRLARQKGLKDLWNKTIAEARTKGIKDQDFPQFWTKKHDEVLGVLAE
jgi:TRAP transporter TAXI family solute receptor